MEFITKFLNCFKVFNGKTIMVDSNEEPKNDFKKLNIDEYREAVRKMAENKNPYIFYQD